MNYACYKVGTGANATTGTIYSWGSPTTCTTDSAIVYGDMDNTYQHWYVNNNLIKVKCRYKKWGDPLTLNLDYACADNIKVWYDGIEEATTNGYTYDVPGSWGCIKVSHEDGWVTYDTAPPTPEEQIKRILRERQAPLIITSRKSLPSASDLREIRARETLRRVIGEEKFRSFLKTGFISVRAKSGLVYQIGCGQHGGMCFVYQNGVKIESICIYLRGDFPPTDNLIMKYLMILNNEQQFRSIGNISKIQPNPYHKMLKEAGSLPRPAQKSLVELYRDLKQKAA